MSHETQETRDLRRQKNLDKYQDTLKLLNLSPEDFQIRMDEISQFKTSESVKNRLLVLEAQVNNLETIRELQGKIIKLTNQLNMQNAPTISD